MADIISFYSYKGGVGRSLSLANVAALLAIAGRRVVCIDFDLEAGGLHTIFGVPVEEIRYTLLDLLASIKAPSLETAMINISHRLPDSRESSGELWLLPTVSEADKVHRALEPRHDLTMFLGNIINYTTDAYNPHFILIDSRSGFAELASAPIVKADRLICVLRPNKQNADGLRILLDILGTWTLSTRPESFLVLSQIPDIPQSATRIEQLKTLLGPARAFGAQIPFTPELALDESVVALTAPNSALARCYHPILAWLGVEAHK